MRKILLILLCLPNLGFSQNDLFVKNIASSIIATKDSSKTNGLVLNHDIADDILNNQPQKYSIILPFFQEELILDLENFNPF